MDAQVTIKLTVSELDDLRACADKALAAWEAEGKQMPIGPERQANRERGMRVTQLRAQLYGRATGH